MPFKINPRSGVSWAYDSDPAGPSRLWNSKVRHGLTRHFV